MIDFALTYNALSADVLMPFVESIEYTDFYKNTPSKLKVSLCNADGRFLAGWRATCGDAIAIKYGAATAEPMAISSISAGIAPAVVTWEASGVPVTTSAPSGRGGGFPPPKSGAFVSERRSWDSKTNVGLLRVAELVCAECGLALKYTAKARPTIPQVARVNETGYHLLERLCRRYGLAVRATAGAVQIVSRPSSKGTGPDAQTAIEIPRARILGIADADSLPAANIKSARRSPRTGDVARASAGDGDGAGIALDFSADSPDALYAEAYLDSRASVLTIIPDARIVAGCIIRTPYGLRLVTEMLYTRTGDTESQRLTTRAAE